MEPSDIDVFDPAHYEKVRPAHPRGGNPAVLVLHLGAVLSARNRSRLPEVLEHRWARGDHPEPRGLSGGWNWSESHFFWRAARMA